MNNLNISILNETVQGKPIDDKELKKQLQLKTSQYGDFNFDDDKWYCFKVQKGAGYPSEVTLDFSIVPGKYRDIVKYFALILEATITTIRTKIKGVSIFLSYLEENFPDYTLSNVNRKIIISFEHFIDNQIESRAMKRHYFSGVMEFFKIMNAFSELPDEVPVKLKNPFKEGRIEKNSQNYIPEFVVKQFDKIMLDEANGIPLSLRVLYWVQRSFPNRIKEVVSMNADSLKALYSYHIITVPTWKQNGGYIVEEIKTLPIMKSEHGDRLIRLIKELQVQRELNISRYPVEEKNKNFLFLLPAVYLHKDKAGVKVECRAEIYNEVIEHRKKHPHASGATLAETITNKLGIYVGPSTPLRYIRQGIDPQYYYLLPFSSQRFNKLMNQISEFFNVYDEDGKIYKTHSHQFRHNATTDRLYIGHYTLDQVRTLRKDKGVRMPMTYAHQQKKYHKQMWMESTGLLSPGESPVEFKGRIINLEDKKLMSTLSKNPNMYLTWEANGKKGVGLCSMITGCKPDGTSVHFECYECKWFIPKAEYYEDYKIERDYWKKIMEKSANMPQRAATFENAIRNVNCLERIIKICENGVEKYKAEKEKELKERD
ncbi:integrase [Neobacillus vireti]|uniref:integrase n=1 Tax=Neobacillus vireti TaxID=220686 RepID=UPI002FFFAD68